MHHDMHLVQCLDKPICLLHCLDNLMFYCIVVTVVYSLCGTTGIPEWKWNSISVDFVSDFRGLRVVVDRLMYCLLHSS